MLSYSVEIILLALPNLEAFHIGRQISRAQKVFIVRPHNSQDGNWYKLLLEMIDMTGHYVHVVRGS